MPCLWVDDQYTYKEQVGSGVKHITRDTLAKMVNVPCWMHLRDI